MQLESNKQGQKQEQRQEREQEQKQGKEQMGQSVKRWIDNPENKKLYPSLHEICRFGKVEEEKLSYCGIEKACKKTMAVFNVLEQQNENLKKEIENNKKVIEEYKNMKRELEGVKRENKELKGFIKSIDKTKEMRAFKRGKGGRKEKEIDWGKYERLRAEGATQQQAADIMKVGVSTLRRKLKECKKA